MKYAEELRELYTAERTQRRLAENALERLEASYRTTVRALAAALELRDDQIDLMMPKLDGFSVLEQIQDDPEMRFLPVVVLTGKELSDEERIFLRFRAFSVLQKASSSSEALRRLVGSAGARLSPVTAR